MKAKVTKLRPPRRDADEITIEDSIEDSIEDQRFKLWQAQAAIETVAAALYNHIGGGHRDWPNGVPHFAMVLERAAKDIKDVTEQLEVIATEANAS